MPVVKSVATRSVSRRAKKNPMKESLDHAFDNVF